MGHRLRRTEVENGHFIQEKACENYKCRSCGRGMISVNFVNGLCIQVFVSHKMECEHAEGNPAERTIDVSCDTCRYHSKDDGCIYNGEYNSSIASVRTNAASLI
ncbi:MAG: hypothetical protein E7220_04790 [Clostridiales bacterium]|nr:hypothetical protein [Clostridiales bacterium]